MDDSELAALRADPARFIDYGDPAVRRLAVAVAGAADGDEMIEQTLRRVLRRDPEARVRAEAAEALGRMGAGNLRELMEARDDPDPIVVEAVATAFGEIGDPEPVPWLVEAARTHPDRLVREAAVASVGAIGDPAALPVLLELAASGPPQVRRRSVVALTVFDGDEVEQAIRAALSDRNPMVREAAEMIAGRPLP